MNYERAKTEVKEQITYFIKDGWDLENIIDWLEFQDVGNAYPTDWLNERADSLVNVYNSDLLDWLGENYANATLVNDAVEEFGYPGDLFKAIMQGQYLDNEELLKEAMQDLAEEIEEMQDNDLIKTSEDLKTALKN